MRRALIGHALGERAEKGERAGENWGVGLASRWGHSE